MTKPKKSKKNQKFNRKVFVGLFMVVLVTLLLCVTGIIPTLYKSSVLSIPEHAPFNGTTYPIKQVPDWAHLGAGKWNQKYAEFKSSELIDMPTYNANQLEGTSTDTAIRNAQTTYSVVYMGNYKFDHIENAGSHPAVDIKIPEGTPVYAIANGTAIKASTQNDGFGHHIVIQHNNVPSFDNENIKTTIYSSYSHLSSLTIADRDVVKKGQLMGYSGMTGTATTPHLHFQIDNDEAPWHPFWPFTWQDVRGAGLDFFSAINAGLGKDSAATTTINPMEYIQKYMGGDAEYVDNSEVTADNSSNNSNNADSYADDVANVTTVTTVATVTTDDNVEDVPVVGDVQTEDVQVVVPEVKEAPKFSSFKITVDPKYYVGKKAEFTITAVDQYGDRLSDGFQGEAIVSATDGTVSVNRPILTSFEFSPTGEFMGNFSRMSSGGDKLQVAYQDQVYYSDRFTVVEDVPMISFTDLADNSKYHDQIIYLASKGVVKGYSDGTFKPTKSVSRAEALKLILEGNGTPLSTGRLAFKDVKTTDWFVRYIYTAKKKDIAGGYPDKTFKPNNTVTKAEFLKILFNAMNVKVDDSVAAKPYNDVNTTDWFAPYFAKAKDIGVLDSNTSNINPSTSMTRQEVADAIYRVMEM
ncbi:MAG: S-layer homology domain-containing protein [Candidatus Gracilibacteria bacterium]|jgi:hypothetical protein